VRAWLLIAALSIVSCRSGDETDPAPPTCRTGFRNQCIAEAALGSHFGCALLVDRTVWCWGRNDQGQLGYPTTDLCPEDIGGGKTRSVACHTFPFRVIGLSDAVSLTSGDAFSCAKLVDGTLRCWGANGAGQLGSGTTLTSQTPVIVSTLSNVSSFAAGARHACAIADGRVLCWGANDHGQLGARTTATCTLGEAKIACSTEPVVVPGLVNAVELSLGVSHTCARTTDGLVTCFGNNEWGQLGLGAADVIPSAVHAAVIVGKDDPLTSVLAISAGPFHTCALRDGGAIFCWGRDDHGELGGPPKPSAPMGCVGTCSALAIEVLGLTETSTTGDAGVDATVESDAGAGDGSVDADAAEDTNPPPETGPIGSLDRSITSGNGFSCVRLGTGTARCWGIDTVGQLGDGRSTSDARPATLVIASPGAAPDNPLQGVAKVRAGAVSACAIMTDDSLRCWGSNQDGALGVGHFTPQQGPVPVSW
jgi:alpha-tubulin suppressor-like RCC1 family protein